MNKIYIMLFVAFFANCKKNTAVATSAEPAENIVMTDAEVNNDRFNGEWHYDVSEDGEMVSTFMLSVQANDNNVSGKYCAIARSGNRIDCSDDRSLKNVTGTIKRDTAYINFQGIYDSKATGKAVLYFKGRDLVWELKESKGEVYVPNKAILSIEKEKAIEKSAGNLPISGKDLKKLPFKEIEEQIIGLGDYYCGGYPQFYECPKVGKYQVKIINNECGDFPFYGLVTTFRGQYVDKKTIYMEEWVNLEDESEKSSTDFTISKDYIITITEKQTVNGKTSSKATSYKIDPDSGRFKAI